LARLPSIIVYDLDGTLVDTGPNIAMAVNRTRRHYGLPDTAVETVVSYVGDGAGKLVERSLFGQTNPGDRDPGRVLGAGPDDPSEEDVFATFMRLYSDDPVDQCRVDEGVMDALQHWHERGVTQAVLTNKPHPLAVAVLGAFDMSPYMAMTIGRGETLDGTTIPTKPNPMGLHHILDSLEVDRSRAWMVGDGQADLGVARAAGVNALILLNGFCSPERYAAMDDPPEHAFMSFREADAFLREWAG
jgi:phosphoglycolate phosphatase